jgi:rubredoxin
MLKTQGGGGIRKKNGHKANCNCPICVNMKHAKGGAGYDVENYDNTSTMQEGGKKSNGHKANCACPICKNMKKSSVKNVAMRGEKTKNMTLKGGKKSNGHKANCKCPICKNMKKRGGENNEDDQESSSLEEENNNEQDDNSDSSSNSNSSSNSSSDMNDDDKPKTAMLGGKKSNGHKANCKCPICKNMKKRGKKTQRKTKGGKKKSHRRR